MIKRYVIFHHLDYLYLYIFNDNESLNHRCNETERKWTPNNSSATSIKSDYKWSNSRLQINHSSYLMITDILIRREKNLIMDYTRKITNSE